MAAFAGALFRRAAFHPATIMKPVYSF